MQSVSSSDGLSSGDEDDDASRLSLALPAHSKHQDKHDDDEEDQESGSRSPSLNDQPIVDDQSDLQPHDVQNMEKDKAAIYKHPLFPLVAMLLEKCEYATATLRMQKDSTSTSSSSSSPASSSPVAFDAFHAEVQAFVRTQQSEGKPLLSDDPELDNLMIKAIQVLRIHLLELEKVQDLCKDFCQRYITCLRTKMSSENLLRGATGFSGGGSFDDSSRSSSPSSGENSPAPPIFHRASQSQQVFDMVQRSQGLAAHSIRGAPESVQESNSVMNLVLDANRDSGNEGDLSDEASNANGGGGSGSSKKSSQKRGILPKQATSVMRSWLFQHIVHPYPTEDEKRAIATQTNLTLLQVNNWFINARRRILQPMLDSANSINSENNSNNNITSQPQQSSSSRSSPTSAKKTKCSTSRGSANMHRHWSESVPREGEMASARSSND